LKPKVKRRKKAVTLEVITIHSCFLIGFPSQSGQFAISIHQIVNLSRVVRAADSLLCPSLLLLLLLCCILLLVGNLSQMM